MTRLGGAMAFPFVKIGDKIVVDIIRKSIQNYWN